MHNKNMKKNIRFGLIVLATISPVITFAALDGLKQLLVDVRALINLLIPVVIGLAVIFFMWGTAQFVLKAGDQKLRQEGKNKMIWGIIAIFIMVSIMGIISLIGDTLGIPVGNGLPGFQNCQVPGNC